MPKHPPKHRPALRRCAWVAALLLCLGQAVASLHVHGLESAEDACIACALGNPTHPSGGIEAASEPRFRHLPQEAPPKLLLPGTRPFQIPPCRAPPIS